MRSQPVLGANLSKEIREALVETLPAFSAGGVPSEEPAGASSRSWIEVVRKKANNKTVKTATPASMTTPAPASASNRGARSHPPAILVDVSREDFPALAKKIRGGANREVLGNHIVGMRQTKDGGILFEVRGNKSGRTGRSREG